MDEKNKYETEIDFKSLPKSPSRLFGWIYPYYLVLFVIVGIFFVKHMDFASKNTIPANYTDSLDFTVSVEVKKGGVMPAIDLGIIANPTKEMLENGKTLFTTNCASCHGNEGKGDGVAAVALNPPPRNFYDENDWKNGRKFNEIYKTLQEGIPGGGMIAYEFLPVEDRISIIHYIRSLGDFPVVNEEVIAEIDNAYDLSKGINSPNNITLEMATKKISEEGNYLISDIKSALIKLNNDSNTEGINLFNRMVDDKEKVIAIFLRDFLNDRNSDKFISRIITFPEESGFKMAASMLSKRELNSIFDILSNSTS